jgi:hypothetical protein
MFKLKSKIKKNKDNSQETNKIIKDPDDNLNQNIMMS